MKPLGQVQLICEKANKYVTLAFQALPQQSMANKPALLSGCDSERLSLIKITDEEVYATTQRKSISQVPDDLPGYSLDPCKQQQSQIKTLDPSPWQRQLYFSDCNTQCCNHVKQINLKFT